jgi:geranylgeranyl pyrophosphate synthase
VIDLLERLHANGEMSAAALAKARAVLAELEPSKSTEQVRWLFEFVVRQGSIDYARSVARQWADKAETELATLSRFIPASSHRQLLEEVTLYVHRRTR